MNAISRRIYLYWVLLFLPTLGVGLGAFYLLNREEGRLLSRADQLEQARRTALRARAQLAAENAELIISDLESGLLDTLASAPGQNPDHFLQNLKRANPLVHETFRCDATGRLLRPLELDEDENGRAFFRRFSSVLLQAPFVRSSIGLPEEKVSLAAIEPLPSPFDVSNSALPATVASSAGGAMVTGSLKEEASSKGASYEQAQDNSNYALNVQRARRDVQSLAKLGPEQNHPPAPRRAKAYSRSADDNRTSVAAAASDASAPVLIAKADREEPAKKQLDHFAEERAPSAFSPSSVQGQARQLVRGWFPVTLDHRLFLLGYVQASPHAQVRGIELDLTALVSRLGAALPPDLAAGEGLCLKDERGRVFHQAGTIPFVDDKPVGVGESLSSSLLTRVALNAELLPGWSVEAYLLPSVETNSGGPSSFLLLGSLLAATLVISLLSGGILLLQQARASALDALQKTSFVAHVSHELKTPLTTIRLYSDLLEQGRVPSEERRSEYLRTIGRESERLSRLVNNVLDFSRLERGLRALTLKRLDPAEELRRICEVNTPRLAEAGLRLSLVLSDEPLRISADRDALGQILLNLLDNAVKYAAEGGELRVSLERSEEGRILMSVADRGPGVPASECERIFLKFHRIDQSLTAEKGGAGLGLSIARQLARAMQGELRCLPRQGGGALFELSLPDRGKEALV